MKMIDGSMEMDMSAYSNSLSEIQNELVKIEGFVKAIQLISDDPTVSSIVGRLETSIESVKSMVSVCRSGFEFPSEEISEKTNTKKTIFDIRYVDGRQDSGLYASSVDELKRVCEANGNKIEEVVERDGTGAVVNVHWFPQNHEGSTLKEFWNFLPREFKERSVDVSKVTNFDNLTSLWTDVGFFSGETDDANS